MVTGPLGRPLRRTIALNVDVPVTRRYYIDTAERITSAINAECYRLQR